MRYNLAALQNLVDQFERMQGIGHKTAQRMAFYVLGLSDEETRAFTDAITEAHTKIHQCKICCNLAEEELCPICKNPARDKSVVCVVEDPRDVAAIERTHEYNGTYHVLHGAISPMDNIGPDQIRIKELLARLNDGTVEEVIMATNPTVEGEATAMYISRLLKPMGITVSRRSGGRRFGVCRRGHPVQSPGGAQPDLIKKQKGVGALGEAKQVIARNKKAFHDYFVLDTYEAGLELFGTEIKSIRQGKVNLKDSWCSIDEGQMYAVGVHISPYDHGNIFNRDPMRRKRLLLHKKEILRLAADSQQQGLSVIPLQLYIIKGRAKLEIGLCKGKKLYDKRAVAAKKASQRDIDRALKDRQRD